MTNSSDKRVSRRKFLKTVSQGTAAVATAGVAGGAMHAAATKPSADTGKNNGKKNKVQYGMLIDLRRCIGCQACTVACKAEADVPMGVSRSWVEYVEKGLYPNAGRSFLPRLCNHCSEPHCVRVCPTGATYERPQDGLIVIDQGVCIGCLYCAHACPYGMRFLNPVTRFADKCDMCIHRVSKGLVPSCVNTCQGRARIFGDVNDPTSEIHKLIARNPVSVIRETYGTQPNVYYIGLDTTDENTKKPGQYVRVTTNKANSRKRT
ncbi:MAG: 4Fe-4S dicluster domain-containing protein [Gammaproteobacteria bacterium]|nr:4Fe-4S dicluster domain-containing protein [Gammaproteobacteria bacterium]